MKISKLKASTSMRKLGGVGKSIPRQDRTSKGLQAALNRRDGGPCEGTSVRPPTSGRMRARGGSVTGAETFDNDSISNNPMFDPKKKSGLFGYAKGGKVKGYRDGGTEPYNAPPDPKASDPTVGGYLTKRSMMENLKSIGQGIGGVGLGIGAALSAGKGRPVDYLVRDSASDSLLDYSKASADRGKRDWKAAKRWGPTGPVGDLPERPEPKKRGGKVK